MKAQVTVDLAGYIRGCRAAQWVGVGTLLSALAHGVGLVCSLASIFVFGFGVRLAEFYRSRNRE